MQLYRLDVVQAIRKPYSKREWPGAFSDPSLPGLPFGALCKKWQCWQSNSFQASSHSSASVLAEPSSHQHRFLPALVPLGDLPLQILIQLTLLCLWDLRRWRPLAFWLQAITPWIRNSTYLWGTTFGILFHPLPTQCLAQRFYLGRETCCWRDQAGRLPSGLCSCLKHISFFCSLYAYS